MDYKHKKGSHIPVLFTPGKVSLENNAKKKKKVDCSIVLNTEKLYTLQKQEG